MSEEARNPSRRRFRRVAFDGTLFFLLDGERRETRVEDISLKGVLSERPGWWNGKPGDCQVLELVLGEAAETIHMDAVVAHTDQKHVGFEWKEIGLEDFSLLRRLLALNLADEELLEREIGDLVGGS